MSVRASFVAVAVVMGTVFVVGCAQPSSPTSPSSLALSAVPNGGLVNPASAPATGNLTAAAADHTLPPDVIIPDVPSICPGGPVTVTLHFVQFIYHENLDATGGGHFTSTGVFEITTSDGFSGRGRISMGGNFGPGHSGIAEQTFTETVTAGDGSGQRVVVHHVMHVVFKDGVPIVEFAIDRIECLGKPVA
jgi:hypothetical protein